MRTAFLCNDLTASDSPIQFEPSNTTDIVMLITYLKDELRSFQINTKRNYKHNLVVKPITEILISVFGIIFFFFTYIISQICMYLRNPFFFMPTNKNQLSIMNYI